MRNEVVSVEAARSDYGVVIGTGGRADLVASERLRAEMRCARGWREVPTVTRD